MKRVIKISKTLFSRFEELNTWKFLEIYQHLKHWIIVSFTHKTHKGWNFYYVQEPSWTYVVFNINVINSLEKDINIKSQNELNDGKMFFKIRAKLIINLIFSYEYSKHQKFILKKFHHLLKNWMLFPSFYKTKKKVSIRDIFTFFFTSSSFSNEYWLILNMNINSERILKDYWRIFLLEKKRI